METNEFIKQHYNTALKIHEICHQKGMSVDDARLLTYIHCKVIEHSGDMSYFDKQDPIAIEALEYMLNTKDSDKPKQNTENVIVMMPEHLSALDASLREQFGMEIRIRSELNNRLKFHTNILYRLKMLDLYKNKIKPFLSDQSKVA